MNKPTLFSRPLEAVIHGIEAKYPEAKELRPCNDEMRKQIAQQIGRNIWGISGGVIWPMHFGIAMPAGKGYIVLVELQADDTYRVTRAFKRGHVLAFKGTQYGIYCEDVAEIAYCASCYVNVQFPLKLQN
jgi:hypothetical protein